MELNRFHHNWREGTAPTLVDKLLVLAKGAAQPDSEFRQQPARAMLVGRFVRDHILGLKPQIAEVELYGVNPESLRRLLLAEFPAAHRIVESFGLVKLTLDDGSQINVSVLNAHHSDIEGEESGTGTQEPREILTAPEGTCRNAFTIESLAIDLLTDEIVDPVGGVRDIRNRVLRIADREQFQDHPLQVMRAVQLCARFDLTVEPASQTLMECMVARGDLDDVADEQIAAQMQKLLILASKPSTGLTLMREIGIAPRLFPELAALVGVQQDPQWHPEGDVWIHTLMVVDEAAILIHRHTDLFSALERMGIMYGALLHDVGKPATTQFEDGRYRAKGHEEAGEQPARALLSRLYVPEAVVEMTVAITTQHLKPGVLYSQLERGQLTDKSYASAIRKLLRRIEPTPLRILLAASEADARGRTVPGAKDGPYLPGEAMLAAVAAGELDKPIVKPLIGGREVLNWSHEQGLKKSPGPWIGKLIRHLEAARDEGLIESPQEALSLLERQGRTWLD